MTAEWMPHPLWEKLSIRQFFKVTFLHFLAIGLTNFLIGYTVFWLCLKMTVTFPLKVSVSQVISYGVGIAWSFYWNRRVTFKCAVGPFVHQAGRFVSLQIALALISAALIGVSVDILDFPPTHSWFVVMSGITVANFLLCKWWALK